MAFTERGGIEAGFGPVFDTDIAPQLVRLEADRVTAAASARNRLLVSTGLGAAAGAMISSLMEVWGPLLFLGITGLVVGFVLRGWVMAGWKGRVADAVMPPVLRFVGDLAYSREAEGGFPLGAMRDLGLFGAFNRQNLSHKVRGQWQGTGFEMVQANLRKRSSGGSNGSGSTRVVFQGLLFAIEVPETSPTPILIAREYGKLANQLSGFFAFGKRRGMPRVEFDHAAFEEVFEVHAEDPDAARAFMPLAFLDTLLAIGDAEGGQQGAKSMTAGFEGDRFYLALAKGLGFLDLGDVDRTILDIEEALHALFDDLTIIRRIIDRLHGAQPVAA